MGGPPAALTFLLTYGETGGDPDDMFVLESGIYVAMAGGVLRFVLGAWLGHQLEKEERVLTMLGRQDETLATPVTVDKEPTP